MNTSSADFSPSMAFALCLLMGSTAFAQPRGPLVERNPAAVRCELEETRLRGEVTLDTDCYYEQSFTIEDPDTTLDCNGAELRPTDGYALNIKREADRTTVRNCYVSGVKGIAVRVRRLRNGETDDEVRAMAPAGVVIENVRVSNVESVGVHLHQHTVGVTLRDSQIVDNSAPGIYMSPYGRHHQIINNLIEGNGHIKPDGFPRIGWYRREGIAIDASSEHYIGYNDINDNAFGGILLYKNCWEHAAEEPNSRPRTDPARANVIEHNHFREQPFGVWIAARQSRDLSMMGCGDPTPYANPIAVHSVFHPQFASYPSAHADLYLLSLNMAAVWPDFADDNVVHHNVFEDIDLGGIRVEDDGSEITDNLFLGDFDYIFVGAPFRARLADQPVRDTVITGNAYHSPRGDDFNARLALIPDEHVGTELSENHRACQRADGQYVRHGALDDPDADDAPCPDALRCDDGEWRVALDDDCAPVDARPPDVDPLDAGPLDARPLDAAAQPDAIPAPDLSDAEPTPPPSSDGGSTPLDAAAVPTPPDTAGEMETTAAQEGCNMGLDGSLPPGLAFCILLSGVGLVRRRLRRSRD